MSDKTISLLGVHPLHSGHGEASRIELTVVLEYLKGHPIASTVLTPGQALQLAERLLAAVRSTTDIP